MKDRISCWGRRLFFTFASVCLTAAGFAQTSASTDTDNSASAPEPVQYTIEDIQGPNVQVLENGGQDWEAAQEGQVLEEGDEIKAGDGSQATLMMQSDTSVHLNADSNLKVEQIQANDSGGFLSRLEVLGGLVLSDVKKNLEESQSSFEVDANGVVCGVRGTAFEVNVQGDQVDTATHEGQVDVQSGGETHSVMAGNLCSFHGGRFFLQRKLTRMEIARFHKWRQFRRMVIQKRFQRLRAIREHRLRAWHRRHRPMMMQHRPQ